MASLASRVRNLLWAGLTANFNRFEIIDGYSDGYVSKSLTDERAISLLKNFFSMEREAALN